MDEDELNRYLGSEERGSMSKHLPQTYNSNRSQTTVRVASRRGGRERELLSERGGSKQRRFVLQKGGPNRLSKLDCATFVEKTPYIRRADALEERVREGERERKESSRIP